MRPEFASPIGTTSVTKSTNTCISSKISVVTVRPALKLPMVASGIVSNKFIPANSAFSLTCIALLGTPTTMSLKTASTNIFLKKCFVASSAFVGELSPSGVYLPRVNPLAISLKKFIIVPKKPTFPPA